ncbi:MAG: thioredoxin [Bacteroidales bacterium]|jgi:thioredoxin|nr:thioredoxin [Bacteroidales bacterium]
MKVISNILLAGAVLVTACGASRDSKGADETEITQAAAIDETADQLPATIAAPKESKVQHISETEFKKLIFDYTKNTQKFVYEGGSTPCIVDFYATWCGPCKRLAPILDDLSWEYRDKVKFYKIDTDKNREISSVFQVRSIPTLMYVNNKGELLAVQAGLPSRDQLVKVIEEHLVKQ